MELRRPKSAQFIPCARPSEYARKVVIANIVVHNMSTSGRMIALFDDRLI
jgi:hypothetical protein